MLAALTSRSTDQHTKSEVIKFQVTELNVSFVPPSRFPADQKKNIPNGPAKLSGQIKSATMHDSTKLQGLSKPDWHEIRRLPSIMIWYLSRNLNSIFRFVLLCFRELNVNLSNAQEMNCKGTSRWDKQLFENKLKSHIELKVEQLKNYFAMLIFLRFFGEAFKLCEKWS